MWRTGKLRTDWAARMGDVRPPLRPRGERPRVLVHAVSVGEVNAVRALVAALSGTCEVVVSATTDTGLARAVQVFEPDTRVVRFPFDISTAVRSFLDAVRPDAALLCELEVWPNFSEVCVERGIPLAVVNGRLSARSFRGYFRGRALLGPMFRRLSAVGAQDEAYAQRFAQMGVPPDRITVTGTMKWDTAEIADHVPGADELAREMGIDRGRPVIVAGSTAPDEHAMLHAATPEGVQLLCAPRKPEWFDRAAQDIPGPRTEDFAATADALRAGGGLVDATRNSIARVIAELVGDAGRRAALGRAARDVVRAHQGATGRTCALAHEVIATSRARAMESAG